MAAFFVCFCLGAFGFAATRGCWSGRVAGAGTDRRGPRGMSSAQGVGGRRGQRVLAHACRRGPLWIGMANAKAGIVCACGICPYGPRRSSVPGEDSWRWVHPRSGHWSDPNCPKGPNSHGFPLVGATVVSSTLPKGRGRRPSEDLGPLWCPQLSRTPRNGARPETWGHCSVPNSPELPLRPCCQDQALLPQSLRLPGNKQRRLPKGEGGAVVLERRYRPEGCVLLGDAVLFFGPLGSLAS